MTKQKLRHELEIGVLDAIYRRRAVRSYTGEQLDRARIEALLAAAVQAPTAMHEEPWVFTVIQDKRILKQLSDAAKNLLKEELEEDLPQGKHARDLINDAAFNVFYDAGTLVVIWAKPVGSFAAADCWLAAENLMLAACGAGLGSCVIGFAVGALNTPEWKRRLGVHEKMTAIAPVILGVPAQAPPPVPRKKPEILSWQ